MPAASRKVRSGFLVCPFLAVLGLAVASRPADDPPAQAAAAYQEAERLRVQGEASASRNALPQYQKAVSLYHEAGDRMGECRALFGMARTHDALSDKRKALDAYLLALPLAQEARDHALEADMLIGMALDYVYLSQPAKAREAVAQAIAADGASGRPPDAQLLTHAGQVFDQLGDHKKALDYFSQALPLQRASANRRAEAETLSGMGVAYYSMGQPRQALESLEPALAIYRSSGSARDLAYTLTSIGAAYFSLSDFTRALENFEPALAGWERAGDLSGKSSTLHNMAAAYDRLGQWEKAIDFYTRALEMHRAADYSVGIANTLSNLGRLYTKMGDTSAALDYFNRALPLQRASGNRALEASTLHSIGLAYDILGDHRKGLDFYQQALELRRAASDRAGEADTLGGMACAHFSLGEQDLALESGRQALELHRAAGNRSGEAFTLAIVAAADAQAGKLEEARAQFGQALEIFRALGDRKTIAMLLYRVAFIDNQQQRFHEARGHIEEALGIVEGLRSRVTSPELRASFFASVREDYDLDVDILMRLHGEQRDAGFEVQAFDASERARSRSLLDVVSELGVDIREGVDPKLLDRERALKQSLDAKADREIELRRGRNTKPQLDAVAGEITALSNDYRALEAEIRSASPHYAALTHPQPLQLETIQKELLDSDTLLIQYALGLTRSYAWLVGRDSLHSFALPSRNIIEAAARRYYELVSAGDPKAEAAAQDLSKIVFGEMTQYLGGKRLAIVPDGALEFVPFGALPVTGPNGPRPLLAGHEIVMLPSCSTLAVQRAETASRVPAPGALAVLADPVFRKDDARVRGTAPGPAAAPAPASDPVATRTAALNLVRLTASRREAQSILAMVPAGQSKQALDFDANLATATGADLARYRVVHFATHAFLDTDRPELSSIVLSLVDRDGQPRDGILRLRDIYNLRWNADLVVLSACETALGKQVRGEGLVGLARGFMYAGVPRVAASLWKVDDRATAETMQAFYQEMLGAGHLAPAAALRSAQLKLMRQPRWKSPYYWASFVLRGDWR